MIFLSNPSVYSLPGTWEKQPLIQHGSWDPIITSPLVFLVFAILFIGIGYALSKRT